MKILTYIKKPQPQPIMRTELNPRKLFKFAVLANVKGLIQRIDEGEHF